MSSANGVALIVGAGDALGGAIARRFAREGFTVVVARRNADKLRPLVDAIAAAGGKAIAFALDARREQQVVDLFARIESEIGPLDVVVFNVGGNVRFSILEMTAQKYFKTWEMAAMSGFLCGREAAKRMVARGRGTMLFTGATASLRGGSGYGHLRAARRPCACWRKAWRANSGRRASTSRMSSSTARSTPNSSAHSFRSAMR